jgi:hypothetical protein
MNAHYHLSPRTQFVLRRGLIPWGLLAGVAAGALIAFGIGRDHDARSGLETVVLVIICFAIWAGLIGWTVGGILWETRPPADGSRRHARPPRTARTGDPRD